jgi:uncharacterized protein YqhQ
MLKLVDKTTIEKVNKCYKISFVSGEIEFIEVTSMGITENFEMFITFYNEDKYGDEELVCMINHSLIAKIETVISPKVSLIVNGKKDI